MQKINLKKTTKEQMLNMLEKAWQANARAADDIAALSKRIEEQNDALAKCVAEKNELRDQARDATGNAEYWHGRYNNAYNVTEVQRQRIKEDAEELRRERVNVETMTNQRDAAIAESKDLRTKLDYTDAVVYKQIAIHGGEQNDSGLILAAKASRKQGTVRYVNFDSEYIAEIEGAVKEVFRAERRRI